MNHGTERKARTAGIGVFLDRDGVLNRLVYNSSSGQFESPHERHEFQLIPGALAALRRLQERGASLFLVSNQPDFAIGKATMEEILAIQQLFLNQLTHAGVQFQAFYYCYHHPNGKVAGYRGKCPCRKPGTFFLEQAEQEFKIRLKDSWMVGDRDADVECGRRAGCKTILIECPESATHRGNSKPDYTVTDFNSAARLLEKLWDGGIDDSTQG